MDTQTEPQEERTACDLFAGFVQVDNCEDGNLGMMFMTLPRERLVSHLGQVTGPTPCGRVFNHSLIGFGLPEDGLSPEVKTLPAGQISKEQIAEFCERPDVYACVQVLRYNDDGQLTAIAVIALT